MGKIEKRITKLLEKPTSQGKYIFQEIMQYEGFSSVPFSDGKKMHFEIILEHIDGRQEKIREFQHRMAEAYQYFQKLS